MGHRGGQGPRCVDAIGVARESVRLACSLASSWGPGRLPQVCVLAFCSKQVGVRGRTWDKSAFSFLFCGEGLCSVNTPLSVYTLASGLVLVFRAC